MELILPTAVKKLDLAYNIDSEVPKWVSADYARIRQVLMNLIGNSVKVRIEFFASVVLYRRSAVYTTRGDQCCLRRSRRQQQG